MSLSIPSLYALSRSFATDVSSGPDALRSRSSRRAQGAFFTPPALVSFVVTEALEKRFAKGEVQWHEDGYPHLRILDPSAGDGRFLVAAADALVEWGRRLGRPASVSEIRKHCLLAIERDPEYAAIASQNLHGETEVHCAEALLSGVVADGTVDVVVGNPPYLRSIALGVADDALRGRLRNHYAATSHGEWDLYAAFLEQGMCWLRERGVLGMVVPSRWWTAQWAGPLRAKLGKRGAVSSLVDFGHAQIFSGATVYASVCFAGADPSTTVEVAKLDDGTWDVGQVYAADLEGVGSWELAVGKSRDIIRLLRSKGRGLGEIARIAKGTGTNADSVFLIESEGAGIESDLLRRVLRGRDVVALGAVPEWPKLLMPYDASGKLLSPQTMERRYPRALAYLSRHRDALESRERGRFAGPTFYCFGRPQNLEFLGAHCPKVVVPDVTRRGRALVDRDASMVLDSAYAIRLAKPADISHEALCGILCSRLVRLWLYTHGVPLRGGYTRMKTAYLRDLPVPPAGLQMDAIGDLVHAHAPLKEIDEQVRGTYDVPPELWHHGSD